MVADWMLTLRERIDHHARLMPYALSALSDPSRDVQTAALKLMDDLGIQYEEEHQQDLKVCGAILSLQQLALRSLHVFHSPTMVMQSVGTLLHVIVIAFLRMSGPVTDTDLVTEEELIRCLPDKQRRIHNRSYALSPIRGCCRTLCTTCQQRRTHWAGSNKASLTGCTANCLLHMTSQHCPQQQQHQLLKPQACRPLQTTNKVLAVLHQ